MTILAARRTGVREILVVDTAESERRFGAAAGANVMLDTGEAPDAPGKGSLDALFQILRRGTTMASGIAALRPRGIVVQPELAAC